MKLKEYLTITAIASVLAATAGCAHRTESQGSAGNQVMTSSSTTTATTTANNNTATTGQPVPVRPDQTVTISPAPGPQVAVGAPETEVTATGGTSTSYSTTTVSANNWWSYDHSHPLFHANEFSFDAFASYINTEAGNHWGHGTFDHGTWGGGIGGNYFFLPFVGVDADSSAQCGTKHFIDHVGGNLILRLPIDVAHLAPYIFGGGGRAFNPDWNWYGDAGAGLEFRLNPRLGVFSDGRYVWKDIAGINQIQWRAGIRFVF